MINFRFHLVSLTAVFLAVGLGILVGSTVVDQKIVNRLDREIKSVRNENSQRKADSKELADDNSRQQDFIDKTAPFVVDGRLDGQSVAVVAERGVDKGVVKDAETLLRAAGAEVPAVIWLDDSWKLDTSKRTQDLATALNLQGSSATVRDRALDRLARRLASAPARTKTSTTKGGTTAKPPKTTTTTAPTPAPVDVLDTLENAGFLSVTDGNASDLATFPAHAAHVLYITGDASDFLGTDITSAFARSLTRAHAPTVVAAVYDAGSDPATAPKRGASLASVIDDRVLKSAVSTVDDLELTQGRVASVIALAIAASGNTGHYGYGSGAAAPLPPHPS
jgi:hypothetical protein